MTGHAGARSGRQGQQQTRERQTHRRKQWLRALLLGGFALACVDSPALYGPGLHLQIQVAGAGLVRGELSPDQGGPSVTQVLRPQAEVLRGEGTVKLSGRLGPGGVALHMQAQGDYDHWVIQPGGYDFVVSDELLWEAELAISHAVQVDELDILMQAADADGRLGPLTETSVVGRPDLPPAQLDVSLGWDAAVDLDLHVELPDGTVVGAKNLSSLDLPPEPPPPPEVWMEGAFLDFDSNQHCVLDMRNRENVMWLANPPEPGRYKVYAHLFAPCGHEAVNFSVAVQRDGELIHETVGTQYAYDAAVHPSSGEAPGLLVMEFELE